MPGTADDSDIKKMEVSTFDKTFARGKWLQECTHLIGFCDAQPKITLF